MRFLDANIFIRFITGDDPAKAQLCLTLFEQAERNEIALTTSETIIAEVVYVLSSRGLYRLSREEIRTKLYPVLSLRGFRLPQREMYLRALDLYAAYPIDFEDALMVAQMERQGIAEVTVTTMTWTKSPTSSDWSHPFSNIIGWRPCPTACGGMCDPVAYIVESRKQGNHGEPQSRIRFS